MAAKRVRQNYLAIVVAAVASFVLEAIWYSIFLQKWLDGIGRTMDWLAKSGASFPLQCCVALVAAALVAGTISGFTQLTGEQTAVRGMRVGAALWAGCVVTTWATEYVFEVRSYTIFAINTGFWLVGMVMMGAIVGAWKKKS